MFRLTVETDTSGRGTRLLGRYEDGRRDESPRDG